MKNSAVCKEENDQSFRLMALVDCLSLCPVAAFIKIQGERGEGRSGICGTLCHCLGIMLGQKKSASETKNTIAYSSSCVIVYVCVNKKIVNAWRGSAHLV